MCVGAPPGEVGLGPGGGSGLDLEDVYREQYRPLVGFLTRRIGDPARAEELAQEAFVRAIRHRPENPRSWIYAVAANLARDEGRRTAVRERHLRLVQDERAAAPDPEPEPEERLARDERRQRIHRALAELSERDRGALLMQQDGASYEEIARRLELSEGSVGTTLSRARRRLIEAWERLDRGHEDVAR